MYSRNSIRFAVAMHCMFRASELFFVRSLKIVYISGFCEPVMRILFLKYFNFLHFSSFCYKTVCKKLRINSAIRAVNVTLLHEVRGRGCVEFSALPNYVWVSAISLAERTPVLIFCWVYCVQKRRVWERPCLYAAPYRLVPSPWLLVRLRKCRSTFFV